MEREHIHNILIVCTGNSCRSAMAEGYLKKRLKELSEHISVNSAGTAAIYGAGASPEAVRVMKEADVDISGHQSKPIVSGMIERADIILVMEPYHRDFIIRLVPESRSKVFYLRQFSQDPADDIIPDPIGRGVDFYKQVKDIITDSLEGFIKWVKNLK